MQERVAALGGVLEVKNRAEGCGVVVTARIPEDSGERPARNVGAPQGIALQ
jgi:signal transduction histidine kinase